MERRRGARIAMTCAGHVVDKHRSILLADLMSKIAHGLTHQKLLLDFLDFKHNSFCLER
jgi:hypothetical protein